MPIRYKHRLTKEIATWSEEKNQFIIENHSSQQGCYISKQKIQNDPDWEYWNKEDVEKVMKNLGRKEDLPDSDIKRLI